MDLEGEEEGWTQDYAELVDSLFLVKMATRCSRMAQKDITEVL